MTPDERKVFEDAQDQVFQSSQQLNDSLSGGGRQPPPNVEGTESTLEGQLFGFDFGGENTANVPQTPGGGVPPAPRIGPFGACCISGQCFIMNATECAAFGGSYQGDDVPCSPDPC